MSIENLHRIKGLLLASCERVQRGEKEIAAEMMDMVLDELNSVSSEDLEVNLTVTPDNTANLNDSFLDSSESEVAEEMCEETAHNQLYALVNKMVAGNKPHVE